LLRDLQTPGGSGHFETGRDGIPQKLDCGAILSLKMEIQASIYYILFLTFKEFEGISRNLEEF